MMYDVLISHRHLTTTDTCTNVTHPIVIAYLFVLIIRISLTGLSGIEHNLFLGILIRTNQGTTATGGYHLIPVEAQDTIRTERATHLAVKRTAESLGGILNYRNIILGSYGHDLVNLAGHTIKIDWDNRFRFPPCLIDTVSNRCLQKYRIHIPGILLAVHKYGCGTEVRHRMA